MRLARGLRLVSPWSGAEGIRWVGLLIAAHVIWGAGWVLASHGGDFNDRIWPVNIAVGGFILAAYADVSWLVRARARIVRRRRMLLPDIVRSVGVEAGRGELVAGAGLGLFHREHCPLAAGRAWPPVTRTGALHDGRRACKVCRP